MSQNNRPKWDRDRCRGVSIVSTGSVNSLKVGDVGKNKKKRMKSSRKFQVERLQKTLYSSLHITRDGGLGLYLEDFGNIHPHGPLRKQGFIGILPVPFLIEGPPVWYTKLPTLKVGVGDRRSFVSPRLPTRLVITGYYVS